MGERWGCWSLSQCTCGPEAGTHTGLISGTHTHRSLRPTPSGNLEHPNVANQANVHLFGHVGGILRIRGNPTGPETRTLRDPSTVEASATSEPVPG